MQTTANIVENENILIPYRKKDKWGFCKPDKTIVIPCIYEDARLFQEGYARIKKNGKWGFINNEGLKVIPCIYDYDDWRHDKFWDFNEGYAEVKKDGNYGFINKEGKEVIPCIYDIAEGFYGDYACVYKNYIGWGFINK